MTKENETDNPVLAICYDFDKTLSPDDMQAQGYIQSIDYEVDDFWRESNELSEKNEMDRNLAYMYLMAEKSRGKVLFTKETLHNDGAKVKLYPGVATWFDRIKYFVPADYTKKSKLETLIKQIIDRTASNEILESFHFDCVKEKNNVHNTLDYYNLNADKFVASTLQVDFEETQKKFIEKLDKGAFILDFGCGSGRDTKYFLDNGYKVDAVDGSKEMCRRASEYTGISVKNMMFTELNVKEKYDGIWACSSILHLTKDELENVMNKMTAALKPNGIIYASFKYGNFSGERNGRYFTDMTEETFEELIKKISGITLEEQWITSDVRVGRGEEKWLNVLLRRG